MVSFHTRETGEGREGRVYPTTRKVLFILLSCEFNNQVKKKKKKALNCQCCWMSFCIDSPLGNAWECCRSQGAQQEGWLHGANPLVLQLSGRSARGGRWGLCHPLLGLWLNENTGFNTGMEIIPKVFQRQRCKGHVLKPSSQAWLVFKKISYSCSCSWWRI